MSRQDDRAPPTVGALALDDAVLFQLALRGAVRAGHLAAATAVHASTLEVELAAMERRELIARQAIAGAEHVVASPLGRERAALVVTSEASVLRPFVAAVDDEFGRLNRTVKQILLRWQVRLDRTTEVLNDHTDARYDRQVLADLRTASADADRLLARLEPLRPRYGSLRRRLRDALERASAGDRSAVAGVNADSFHTAWWELHGDLLAILGRARSSSDA